MSKNIWLLPTEKPSRLVKNNSGVLTLGKDVYTITDGKQSIYITNDEKLKNGDWKYCSNTDAVLKVHNLDKNNICKYCKKIILTTDQDLIKEGIQEIPTDFLEWFVKNPSCESVEVKTWIKTFEDGSTFDRMDYEIIIPQDQPKQTIEDLLKQSDEKDTIILENNRKWLKDRGVNLKPTIEEVADIYSTNEENCHPADSYIYKSGFLKGYNHAQTEIDELVDFLQRLSKENNLLHYQRIELEQLITKHK